MEIIRLSSQVMGPGHNLMVKIKINRIKLKEEEDILVHIEEVDVAVAGHNRIMKITTTKARGKNIMETGVVIMVRMIVKVRIKMIINALIILVAEEKDVQTTINLLQYSPKTWYLNSPTYNFRMNSE